MTDRRDARPPGRAGGPRVLFGGTPVNRTPPASRLPRPAVPFGSSAPPAARASGPRIVGGGEVRRRVPCSAVDLMVLDPKAFDATIDAALRIVETTNLDDGGDAVRRFGGDLVERHVSLAEEGLAAAGDGAAEAVREQLGRTLSILRALDPDAPFGEGEGGFLDALRAFAAPPPDPVSAFETGYPALRAAAEALRAALRRLDASTARLRDLAARADALDAALHANALAALFLVRHVRADPGSADARRRAADALEARQRSVEAARETLAAGRVTLAGARDAAEALAATARDVLEGDLPAWHTAYAAVLAARSAGPDTREPLAALRAAHRRTLGRIERETTR